MRDTYASRDAATVVALGRAGEFARDYIDHLAARLAAAAAHSVLAELVAEGVEAAVALPLVDAVRNETMTRLIGNQTPTKRPTLLTLVPRRPKVANP